MLFFVVYKFKQSGTRVRRDLGGVCQDMWNAAPNNMAVGTDLKVDTSAKAVQLFTLSGSGQTKLKDQEYVRFKGKLDSVCSQSTSRMTSIFEILKEFWNLHVSFKHRQRHSRVPVEISLVYWRYKAMNFSLQK